MKTLLLYLTLALLTNSVTAVNKNTKILNKPVHTIDIYKKGQEGYAYYRIPAIIRTKNNTILAFAEGRKNNCSDSGNIDLVVKRSKDDGKTWSKLFVVWDDKDNTCGNPVPILDKDTGRIYLICTWNLGLDKENEIVSQTSRNSRRVFYIYSDNDGLTWSNPIELTKDVKQDSWTWYATGPGHGIQIQKGKYKGRIIVPANHTDSKTKESHSHIIYSDDKGKTWKIGGIIKQSGENESSVVELENGNLMLNMRNYNRNKKSRAYATSSDGGATWTDAQYTSVLIEPICQGSILNYINHSSKPTNRILFSNPSSTNKRENMTIKLSKDNGNTWPYAYRIYSGPSGYSDMVILRNKRVALLYEYGENNAYEKIGFTIVPIKTIKVTK